MYSLTEAAIATGKQRPAIWKAIKSGRLSASKDANNQWRIDPAELHRVYPIVSHQDGVVDGPAVSQEIAGHTNENSLLTQEIGFLREQVADLRAERDRLLQIIEEQAGSLKQLTHQREQGPAIEPPSRSRRWWNFGRRTSA